MPRCQRLAGVDASSRDSATVRRRTPRRVAAQRYDGISDSTNRRPLHRIYGMQILLTNDDGIYAPGLAAMERELQKLGDGRGRRPADRAKRRRPLDHLPHAADGPRSVRRRRGGAAGRSKGSPADCVKLAIAELCRPRPDLVVSGINSGHERRHQRAVLRHGGGGDRRGVFRHHEHRGVAGVRRAGPIRQGGRSWPCRSSNKSWLRKTASRNCTI